MHASPHTGFAAIALVQARRSNVVVHSTHVKALAIDRISSAQQHRSDVVVTDEEWMTRGTRDRATVGEMDSDEHVRLRHKQALDRSSLDAAGHMIE